MDKYDSLASYDRDFFIEQLQKNLDEKRFNHCLRVEAKAVQLAELFVADVSRASIAGLLHDYCKQMPDAKFIETIKQKHLNPELVEYGNGIWHGIVGAEIIADELNIHDEIILNAIRKHTVADPYMTDIDKIVFIADFIEDARDFPEVDEARKLARTSLDNAMAFEIKHTLEYLITNKKKIYPKILDSYNQWVVEDN
ncbi:bis(5'-nucleosyl)-tetraphosphatase (symmetrical) YqeK [Lactobacillus sp. YT155]|uniref:bis(5'-nucleosyl)-tetraphosphatase (symmetrical) YqeK n=1 Tax=Lactobacillus sp. YT155 TaxID=3060955 RepID=UPI00265EDD10|nr:bis(5'-nucleosyl)-tetraphosphatase (symmetrical) YqeK [Lactobacillus sp. YT155]MDO1605601.1 bis(5'-nucleosyl)-tetraphosphatase (symmetrical) YqeK [Lactobacillus sp. YT155]